MFDNALPYRQNNGHKLTATPVGRSRTLKLMAAETVAVNLLLANGQSLESRMFRTVYVRAANPIKTSKENCLRQYQNGFHKKKLVLKVDWLESQ